MVVGALVPPDAARVATHVATRATLASQQCTQVPQNDSERSFSPICVHSCVPTSVHNGATVYTNGTKRLREVIFADLCTLFRSPQLLARPGGATGPTKSTAPWPRDASAFGPEAHATGAVTQPPTRTHEASSILQNYGATARSSSSETMRWQAPPQPTRRRSGSSRTSGRRADRARRLL